MTKNKKIALACVSLLFILIAAVLLIRSPSKLESTASDPPTIATAKPLSTPTVSGQSTTPSDSHEKVTEIIDYTSDAITAEIPGLWAKVKNSWNWLMVLDAKHALILVFVLLFICSIIFGGKNKKSS